MVDALEKTLNNKRTHEMVSRKLHGEETSLGNSGYLLFPFADYVSPFMQIILFVTGIVQFICGFGLIFYESPATKILCAWILAAILIVIDSAVINLPVSIEDAPRAHEWN